MTITVTADDMYQLRHKLGLHGAGGWVRVVPSGDVVAPKLKVHLEDEVRVVRTVEEAVRLIRKFLLGKMPKKSKRGGVRRQKRPKLSPGRRTPVNLR